MITLIAPWRRSEKILASLALLLVLLAIVGPFIAPQSTDLVDLSLRLQPPSFQHWMGTDHLGRDIFSRIIAGSRISLGAVAICLGLIVLIALIVGGLAGLAGGKIDRILMRITEIFMTFPTLILSLFMIGILGTGLTNVIIAITLSHWAWYARIVRSIVLSLKQSDFILAAKQCGANRWDLFREHLLAPISAQLLVLATLDIGHMILHIAGLSFLGLGVAAPTPEWGVMLNDAREYIWIQPMLMIWPGLALFLSVAVFNLFGDAVRDRIDPRFTLAIESIR